MVGGRWEEGHTSDGQWGRVPGSMYNSHERRSSHGWSLYICLTVPIIWGEVCIDISNISREGSTSILYMPLVLCSMVFVHKVTTKDS